MMNENHEFKDAITKFEKEVFYSKSGRKKLHIIKKCTENSKSRAQFLLF